MAVFNSIDGLSFEKYQKLISFRELSPTLDGRRVTQPPRKVTPLDQIFQDMGVFFRRLGQFLITLRWENDISLLRHIQHAVSDRDEFFDRDGLDKISRIVQALELRVNHTQCCFNLEGIKRNLLKRYASPLDGLLTERQARLRREANEQREAKALREARALDDLKALKASALPPGHVYPLVDAGDVPSNPVSMPNPENYCYMNASLQALFASPHFLARVRAPFNNINEPNLKRVHRALGHVLDARKAQDPIEVRNTVAWLRHKLHKSSLIPRSDVFQDLKKGPIEAQQDAACFIEEIIKAVDLEVSEYFETHIEGIEQPRIGEKHPHPYISLSMDSSKPSTLQQLIDHEFAPEVIDSVDNALKLNGVKYSKYRRFRRLDTTPDLLVIGLKRGSEVVPGQNGVQGVKNTQNVHLPENGIVDLSGAYASGTVQYRIIGVVYHQGVTLKRGHYTALTKNPGGVFRCDDQRIQQNTPPEGESYLFVLEKI